MQAGVQIPQAVRAAVQQKSSDHLRYFYIPSYVFTKNVADKRRDDSRKEGPVPNNVQSKNNASKNLGPDTQETKT